MHCNQMLSSGLSPELTTAQERLLQLRNELLADRGDSHSHHHAAKHEVAPNRLLHEAQAELRRRRELASVRVDKTLARSSSDWVDTLAEQYSPQCASPPSVKEQGASHGLETVPVYPSILTAILREHMESAGRIYLLLHHLDTQGRGWLSMEHVRHQLTNNSSPLRVCGWRRLRQLLHQGEDIFWQRDDQNRLWLRGPHRIAQKLGIDRLQGSRINLPVETLLGGIQAVRAHFYATFHSGRRKSAPLSRERLQEITGVPDRTQRAYDIISNTKRERNMAIGPRYTQISAEEQAWQRGRGVFRFVDSQGQQGAPKQEYVAWHLPNSYTGPHSTRCNGRQKRINQRLTVLVRKGMRGNSPEQVEKLFWPNGAAAGRAYHRNGDNDAYWPHNRADHETYLLWRVLGGG